MRRHLISLLVSATSLALAGCGDTAPTAVTAADQAPTENAAASANNPVLRMALRDQIVVDPLLVQKADVGMLRPAPQPANGAVPPDTFVPRDAPAERDAVKAVPPPTAACPQCLAAREALTLGALAEAQGGHAGQCAANVAYSASWANRLPAAVPLYPDARVAEAAGADGAGCALRIVSFASPMPMQRLLDWYYTKTSAAGFPVQHHLDRGEHVLAGTRPDAAFFAMFRPRKDGGTDVDLMADGGR